MARHQSIRVELVQTGWFLSENTPARVGVYGTSASTKHPCFQHWDGHGWGKYSGTPEGAARKAGTRSVHQQVQWYGLADAPASGVTAEQAMSVLREAYGDAQAQ